ncbi:MAG: hypothetical protein Q7K42_02945, partial [Candidatus Diapherotrites archaeon]|nr:hypothetical protein [Candidatus Diapherotrites archaeon]
FMRKQEYGFPGKGIYNTKLKHHQDLYEDSTNYDTGLFKSFQSSDGGRWTPENTVYQTDGVGNIVLYEMSPTGKEIGRIGKGDLEFVIAEGKYREKMTQLQDGTYVLINENNKGVISSQAKSPLSVFDVGWKETGKLTPTDLANKLTEPYVYKRLTNYAPFNAKQLVNTLIEHNFASRKYTSILDKQFAQEAKLLTEYWTLKGGAKFTALPVVYWWSRKGFGIEDISFYQLPLESWTQVIMKTGEEDIYKAAYVDFFANEGSDQGDLFAQVIQKLPWKQIYDKTVSTLFDPIQDTYDYFTGVQRRDTVQNLVFFLTGGKECSTCQYAFSSADNKSLTTTFNSTQKMDSFLFEETKASEDQLLIAFAHATDLVGNPNNNEKTGQEEPIILSAKDTKAKSCREKAKSISLGFDTGTTVGGYYALAENLGYYFFGWPAIIGTFANQLFFLPELHGCIDDQEGYFVHYYIAKPKEGKKQTATEIAASKTANAVQVFKDQFLGLVTGETDSFVDTQAKKVESKIADFVKSNSQAKDVVQAELHFAGFASGKTTATDFFYVWFEGGSDLTKTKYLEEGKMVLKGQTAQDAEGNRKDAEMVLDNKTGELTVNGKKIIDSEDSKDNVRLASTNTAIPAIEIPNRLGKIGLKDSGELFEINLLGSSKVLDDDVLDCIQKAVVDQTGVELNSSDIADAFGPAGLIVTDTYPQLLLVPGEKKLIAEGLTRKTFIGSDVLVKIANSRDVNVISPSINESFYTGKFESLQLENGEILYKASTNELIIWLKRHKDTILSNRDVLNLKATPSSVLNPENDCTENALDLSIIGQPTEAGKQKEDNFNKALQTMGPFQIFDTTDKTFIFYSERDKDGECQNRFKVIDKLTGQIYDQAIKNFEKTADGIRILTADGKEHLINFSAPNGVPTITYNGQDSTLTSAQGRNGAFWYDPEKGMWFADNAQLLPLLEAFKQAGIEFKGNKDGTASAVPGTNIFIGDRVANADNPLANLPSLPENALMFALFLLSIVAVIGTIYLTDKKKKTKKKK